MVLAVFRLLVLLLLSILAMFQGFVPQGEVTLENFAVSYCVVLQAAVLLGVFTRTRSISGFETADTLSTCSTYDVSTAGTALYSQFSAPRTPSIRSISAISTAHTPSTRSIFGDQ